MGAAESSIICECCSNCSSEVCQFSPFRTYRTLPVESFQNSLRRAQWNRRADSSTNVILSDECAARPWGDHSLDCDLLHRVCTGEVLDMPTNNSDSDNVFISPENILWRTLLITARWTTVIVTNYGFCEPSCERRKVSMNRRQSFQASNHNERKWAIISVPRELVVLISGYVYPLTSTGWQ